MKSLSVIIQVKASQFQALSLWRAAKKWRLYKVILTFESVDEILKCNHSNERY